MFDSIKNLFGMETTDFAALVKQGATVVDVRSKGEYAGGHIKNSINIPVDQLAANLARLKDKSKPIITCCASGMRSSSALTILKNAGYTQVYNGGGWMSLNNKI